MTSPFTPNRRTFLHRAAAALAWPVAGRLALAQSPRTFPVTSYGAIPDGNTLCTAAIQRTIDAAANSGGGNITFAPGQYVTGTILLKSNVSLDLPAGVTLLGSLNPADYALVEPFTDGVGTARGYALLGCVDATNVAITGSGTIDARGPQLHASLTPEAAKLPSAKPFLALFLRSSAIRLEGISLLHSAAWTLHIAQCSQTNIANLRIRSLSLPNNDGIDIDSSHHIRVDACTIESGDDAICIKTTSPLPCQDIAVTHCTLTTRCAAFKIGTESEGNFTNISVTDCHVLQANLGAIKLLSVDGAHISNVTVERLQVDDADTPIFLRLGARLHTFRPSETPRPTGTLSNVTLRDITVARASRIGVLISGIPGHPVEDITLERIAITLTGPPPAAPIPDPPENPSAYPEVRMFGANLPASSVYARHVRNLRLSEVKIAPVPGDNRPASQIFPESPPSPPAPAL